MNAGLDALLRDRRLWRASAGPVPATLPSGHGVLDRTLRGGWPRGALTEIQGEPGGPELALLLPALARLTRTGACVAFLAPPHVPYAPALAGAGVALAQVMVVAASAPQDAFWALEQTLRSGACAAAVGWFDALDARALRRLQLAAERGRACGFACVARAAEAAPVALRVSLRGVPGGVEIVVRKGPRWAAAPVRVALWAPPPAAAAPDGECPLGRRTGPSRPGPTAAAG
jgi:hypothetical protein